jgi:hypothetical protein
MSHEVGTDLGMLVRGIGASGYLFDALRTARRTGVGQQRRRRVVAEALVQGCESVGGRVAVASCGQPPQFLRWDPSFPPSSADVLGRCPI